MRVWKKQTVVWMLGEKRSTKGFKGAEPRTLHSKNFYGTLKTYDGKAKQVPLTEDEDTSETLLRQLQRVEDERRSNGYTKVQEHRDRPIQDHLEAFRLSLEARNNTQAHIELTISRIQKLLNETGVKRIDDIEGGKVLNALAKWRQRKKMPMSVGSSNHYLVALKGFTRWLWQDRRFPEDLLCGQKKLNAQTDRRRVRRAMTEDEVKRLIATTQQSGKTYLGAGWQLRPADRVLLYQIALYTGLRSIEIASLKASSFNLESKTLTVEASNTKNRKKASLPIHPSLIEPLRSKIDGQPSSMCLFNGPLVAQRLAGKVFVRDLKRAKVEVRDDQGRVLDFHSLRYTFITNLAKAGVHPGKAQRLARHSDINLTMNTYTQLEVDDLRGAMEMI